jgi:hypothetical protein
LRIFALQRVRDAAGIFDHFEAALDVAAGVGDDLAVLGGEQQGELLDVAFDQLLEFEHDPGATLRIGRGPGRKGVARGGDCLLEVGGGAEAHPGLDAAIVRVEHVALPLAGRMNRARDEMVDITHG